MRHLFGFFDVFMLIAESCFLHCTVKGLKGKEKVILEDFWIL